MRALMLSCLLLPGLASAQSIEVYFDREAFFAATGARDYTGAPPQSSSDSSVQVGFVTIEGHPPTTVQVNPFSDGLPDLNEIAFNGDEEFEIKTFAVHSLGFDFEEAGSTHPSVGASFIDSTFEVTVCAVRAPAETCPAVVGTFRFNAPDSNPPSFEAFFVGIESTVPFHQVSVREVTGGNENEFVGRIYLEFENLVRNGHFDDSAMVDGWTDAVWSTDDRFGDATSGSLVEAGGIPTMCVSIPAGNVDSSFGASLLDRGSITRLFWDAPGCQGSGIGFRQGLGSSSEQWVDTFSRLTIPEEARSVEIQARGQVDNVLLVPEPGSLLCGLFALGSLLGLARVRRSGAS